MKHFFPKTHVARLRKMINEAKEREAELQRRHGDPVPRSTRVSDLHDLRALQEILWCIGQIEDGNPTVYKP